MTATRKIICCSLAILIWTFAPPCLDQGLAQEEEDAVMLDPVKVTAQKREEDVQDIPASVDVIDSEILEDAGIKEMEDLYLYTPNVYRSGSFFEFGIVIRGVKKYMASPDANVVVYVDDVPLPLHYTHNVKLMDVDRVEVLKGPQGTLYGMNSEAGVINIVTKKPGDAAEAKAFLEYGSANTSSVSGMASFPLVEGVLGMRLTAQQKKTDGFITNIATDNDEATKQLHQNVRSELRWTPGSLWEVSLSGDYARRDDNVMNVRAIAGPLARPGFLESDYDYEVYSKQDSGGLNLTLKRQGKAFDFLSVTGYRTSRDEYTQDTDVSSNPTYYYGEYDSVYEDHMVSQEFRLTSPEDSGNFQWVAGLFGYFENLKIDMAYYNRLTMGPGALTDFNNSIYKKGAAVFGEGTYTLFDDLHLTAGLRIAYDRQHGWIEDTVSGAELQDTMDTLEFLPKVAVAYDLSEKAMAYASVTRGFMNGGFKYYELTTVDDYTYKPEYTWNYEVGLKTSWLNDRLTANLAVFYIQIQDKQASDWDPSTGASVIINASKAHTQGFEVEVNALPARGWTLSGSLGVTDARLDEFELADGYDYSGKRMPDVPSYTYNIGTQYTFESGWFGRADLIGIGDFTGDFKNVSREDGYQLVNLRVGREWELGSLYAWCNNAFDERYYKSVYAWDMSGTGADRQAMDGDPRSFGIGASLEF